MRRGSSLWMLRRAVRCIIALLLRSTRLACFCWCSALKGPHGAVPTVRSHNPSPHRYFGYLWCWCCANHLWQHSLRPLLDAVLQGDTLDSSEDGAVPTSVEAARRRLMRLMAADATTSSSTIMNLALGEDEKDCCDSDANVGGDDWVDRVSPSDADDLRQWLWQPCTPGMAQEL